MSFELRVRGLDQVQSRLRVLARTSVRAAAQALREEGEIVMTEAKKRTPVDTGALRASGHVETSYDGLIVRLKFGGGAVTYALPVHERLHVHHPVGQALYLSSALLDAIPRFVDRVALRMRALMRT